MIKTFWVFLLCLLVVGVIVLGAVGIPAKPVTVTKAIPHGRLSQ